jgi:hypothetical protein
VNRLGAERLVTTSEAKEVKKKRDGALLRVIAAPR